MASNIEPELTRTNSAEVRKKRGRQPSTPVPTEEDEDDAEELPYQVQSDAEGNTVRVYHESGTIPDGRSPEQRDGPTTSAIRERVAPIDDLVGDRAPRTLLDLYARWPISEDSNFFLRIERTQPKRYQGLDVCGFVGEVRGAKITEADIQRIYGGKEYKVTLYGPDPRRRDVDDNGDVRVKALTDPITITVPVLPPNPIALPILESSNMSLPNPMNPFGPTMGSPGGIPTTPSDASIHKVNASFFTDALKSQRDDATRREAVTTQATSSLIQFMNDSNKTQVEGLRESWKAREEAFRAEIAELKKQVQQEKQEQGVVAAKVAEAKDRSNMAMMELVQKLGPNAEAEVRRVTEYYGQQLEILRRAHADQMQSMQSRHESDLRRADERLKDTESNYRLLLEQERSQSRTTIEAERGAARQMLESERASWSQREADLRNQTDKQLAAEREQYKSRLEDLRERHSEAMKSLEKSHERELRSVKEAYDVKGTVTESTHKMTLEGALQRLEDAKEEVERLREELEDSKDLSTVLEKAEKTASLLGFEKKDADAPKGPWERFAATAGAGLSQAMSTMDQWLPQVVASRQQQPPGLPSPQQRMVRRVPMQGPMQGPPQAQPQPPGRQRRTSGAEWAAEGVHVRPQHTESMSGFRDEPATKPEQRAPQAPIPPRPATAPPQQVNSNAIPEAVQEEAVNNGSSNGAAQLPVPSKFLQHFSSDALLAFLQQAESAVNNHVDAAGFADLMVAQYAEGASMLVGNFTAEEVISAVEGIPGTETSPLLRRDGRRWMESLFKALKAGLERKQGQATVATQ